MPCGCKVQTSDFKTVTLKNPKTGKVVKKLQIPVQKMIRRGPQLLPGLTRVIKEETYRKFVTRPLRRKI